MGKDKPKQWIVECPSGIYSIDADLEKYLNKDPHPEYELHQAILRPSEYISDSVYVLIWKLSNSWTMIHQVDG